MARIPKDELERLKKETDLTALEPVPGQTIQTIFDLNSSSALVSWARLHGGS